MLRRNDTADPSTLGTFLRAFTFGYVRQLDAVAARFLVILTAQVPVLLGTGQVAFLDIDSRDQSDVRVPQAGRRLRVLQGQGTSCAVRDHLHPAVRAVDRGHASAQRLDLLPARRVPAGVNADALATAGRAGATGLITMPGLRLLAGVLAGLAGREPLSKVP